MIPAIAYSPLVFQVEYLRSIQPEVDVLWREHFAETEGYKNTEMNPALDQFYGMEDAGMFREFTARDEADGRLVGHIGYIVHIDRHTSRKQAVEDFFYLMKPYRVGFNAVRLLRFAIESLKAEGCKQIGMSSKLTNDIEPLLRRVGFTFVAKFYVLEV